MSNSIFKRTLCAFVGVGAFAVSPAHATPLDVAVQVQPPSVTADLNKAMGRSFDKNASDFLDVFAPFVDPDFLTFGDFSGPVSLSGEMVLEQAGYSGKNKFGVMDSKGKFDTLLTGADHAGSTFNVTLPADTYTLAFDSPTGLYSSDPTLNKDNPFQHIYGQQVIKDGSIKLGGLTFSVFAGDYFLYNEDLTGKKNDRDYNDMVLVLRSSGGGGTTEVPEPASMLLLTSGLVGLAAKRRKSAL